MPSFQNPLALMAISADGTRIVYHDEILLAHSLPKKKAFIDLMDKWHIEAFLSLKAPEDVYCKRGTYRQRIMNQGTKILQ